MASLQAEVERSSYPYRAKARPSTLPSIAGISVCFIVALHVFPRKPSQSGMPQVHSYAGDRQQNTAWHSMQSCGTCGKKRSRQGSSNKAKKAYYNMPIESKPFKGAAPHTLFHLDGL